MRRATADAAAAPSSRRTRCRQASMPGGGAGAGDDAVVVDVEDGGVDAGGGELPGQLVGVHPVRGALPPVEQPRLPEGERAAADAQHPGAARVRVAQRVEHDLGHVAGVAVGGHDDEVDVLGGLQAVLDDDRVARRPSSATTPGSMPHSVKSNDGPPVSRRSMPNTSQATPSSKGATFGRAMAATERSIPPASARRGGMSTVVRQFCHSWRLVHGRRLSAMTTFWIVLALAAAAWLVARLVVTLRRDGLGSSRPPALPRRLVGRLVRPAEPPVPHRRLTAAP